MSNLVNHAKKELKLAGLFDKDSSYGGMLGDAALELIKVFADQGHSGCSAGMTMQLFSKLADFKPIVPLTLKDDEWNDIGDETFQNKRNSAVFKKGKDGKAYYIDAYTKRTQNGQCYSGVVHLADGRVVRRCFIKDVAKMPTIVLDMTEKEIGPDDWEMTLNDNSQLEELAKYYDFEFEK